MNKIKPSSLQGIIIMFYDQLQDAKDSKTESTHLCGNYHAPNPYKVKYTGFKLIDGLIGAVTYIPGKIASIPNWFLGATLGKRIVMGKRVLDEKENAQIHADFCEKIKTLQSEMPIEILQNQVITHDDARLDSIQIKYKPSKDHNNICIIKFNGAGVLFEEDMATHANDSVRLKATIIAFNYRSIGQSKGKLTAKTQLVTDGIAQVQRVLDAGTKPQNIVLDGFSLGGSVATLVAKHFHDKGICINLFNDRSFSSVSSFATQRLAGEKSGTYQTVVELLLYLVAKTTNWEISTASAYRALPDKSKGYMHVADASTTYPENLGDGVIPPKSTLHEGIKNKRGQGKNNFTMLALVPTLFKGDRSELTGHNTDRENLRFIDDQKKTGQAVFDDFVTSVTAISLPSR